MLFVPTISSIVTAVFMIVFWGSLARTFSFAVKTSSRLAITVAVIAFHAAICTWAMGKVEGVW